MVGHWTVTYTCVPPGAMLSDAEEQAKYRRKAARFDGDLRDWKTTLITRAVGECMVKALLCEASKRRASSSFSIALAQLGTDIVNRLRAEETDFDHLRAVDIVAKQRVWR